MKFIACINHVPDTEAKIKISTDGKTIDKSSINFILSPYDEFAIEAVLQLKEKFGGETFALSLGGDSHKETLRKALAMGVDRAILLKDETIRDSYSIAAAIAEQLKQLQPEFIFFGKQSIDFSTEQIPGIVAEILGLPSVSSVIKLEIEDTRVRCEREIEGGHEVVEAKFPIVISAQKGLNEPRYPTLKGIMTSKSKPIEEIQPIQVASKVEVISMRQSASKKQGRIIGSDVNAVPELVRLLHEEAKVL